MKPVDLYTDRLVLNSPTLDDADLVAEYCQDPVFETFLTTPWPYTRDDAEKFLGTYVPGGWRKDSEYTWAIRLDGEFVGVIGFRPENRDVGFWLGAPSRGRGVMPEALNGVLDWVFSWSDGDVYWECVLGNVASASVAYKTGFTYGGRAQGLVSARGGKSQRVEWATIGHADGREPKAGWPDAALKADR